MLDQVGIDAYKDTQEYIDYKRAVQRLEVTDQSDRLVAKDRDHNPQAKIKDGIAEYQMTVCCVEQNVTENLHMTHSQISKCKSCEMASRPCYRPISGGKATRCLDCKRGGGRCIWPPGEHIQGKCAGHEETRERLSEVDPMPSRSLPRGGRFRDGTPDLDDLSTREIAELMKEKIEAREMIDGAMKYYISHMQSRFLGSEP